ncbi:MAG: hypothetical protein JSU87_12115 [Gemmatimonadota bacterium]|nr:MAG: hypothetical protein JSU87_12115 [Gemmatimonadota bacterium]
MSHRRATATLLLPVMLIQFAGCFKWTAVSDPIAQHVPNQDPWEVRVTLNDGRSVRLWDAEIVDDSIEGYTQPPPRSSLQRMRLERTRFPLEQVERLEEGGLDSALTFVAIITPIVLLVVGLAAGLSAGYPAPGSQ